MSGVFSSSSRSRVRTVAAAAGVASLAGAAGAATLGAGWLHARDFQLDEVTVPLLPEGGINGRDEFRILHLSDIHLVRGEGRKIEFLHNLAALRPDLVVNTGDNLGEAAAVPTVLQALTDVLHFPGVFVFGNNDYHGPRPVNPLRYLTGKKQPLSAEELPWRGLRAGFLERGWVDATNTHTALTVDGINISIAGVDDPHTGRDDLQKIGRPHQNADLSLALTHSPEPRVLDSFARAGYQLALAGHTHGGQFCLPDGKAIVTNCGIHTSMARGLTQYGAMMLHVSGGLGTSKYMPLRYFCPPSVTLLRLVTPSTKN